MRYSDNDIIVHSDKEYDDDEEYQGFHKNHHHNLAQQTQNKKSATAADLIPSNNGVGASNKF